MVEAAKGGATVVADAGSAKDSFERQSKIRLAFFLWYSNNSSANDSERRGTYHDAPSRFL